MEITTNHSFITLVLELLRLEAFVAEVGVFQNSTSADEHKCVKMFAEFIPEVMRKQL